MGSQALRAGLVGIGFGGAVAFPALRSTPGIEVTVVCSAHLDRARAFADAHGIPAAVDKVDALVERDDVDLVVVCTPPMLHARINRAALEAGRHVFSTKPIASKASEALALWHLADEGRLVTAMDFDNRYVPVRRYIRHLVQEGYLGVVRCVVSTVFVGYTSDPTNRNYYWNWVGLRDECGGMLGASLGLHYLDLLRFMFGEVTTVGGVVTTAVTEKPVLAPGYGDWEGLGPGTPTVGTRPVDAEDTVVISGHMERGGVFSMTGSWSVHNGSAARLEAYGSEGTLVLDRDGRLFGARPPSTALKELDVPETFGARDLARDWVGRMRLLFADVVATIRGEITDPPFATFHDGARLREIAEAVIGR